VTITFADLGVPADIEQRLAERGIDAPFPIQTATVPDALAGRDLCGRAPTGSGKTIAFGIPLVANVKRAAPKRPKGLVLVPTRELALQVADELTLLGDLRVLAVYGGAGIEPQMKKLRAGVDIVVACPGRLQDVIDRKACDLRDVSFVVLDEADRMADMGFLPSVRRLLDLTASKRQTLLFSATLDGAVDTLVRAYQQDPVVHELADEEDRGQISHRLWVTADRNEKVQVTAEIVERAGPTVVFSRTKHGADRIARQLAKLGVTAAAIHGNRSQGQRERALGAFHRGEVMALVATDVAARGIHVEGVRAVVHFDLPADPKDYVHRSGRTGRAGEDGAVIGLLGEPDRRAATKLLRQAGVEGAVAVTAPAVGDLPAGHQAFAEARRRKAEAPAERPADVARPAAKAGGGGGGRGRSGGRKGHGARPAKARPTTARAASGRGGSGRPAPAKAKAGARAGGGGNGGGGGRGRPARRRNAR